MAINRRDALKCGISYGTGVINHGNDSVVYNRELKKFPANETYPQLKAAIDSQDLEAAKTAAAAFRQLCGDLALSDVYMKLEPICKSLDEDSLPSIAEINEVDDAYSVVVNYLENA